MNYQTSSSASLPVEANDRYAVNRRPYTLMMPENCMWGRGADLARSAQAPLGLVYPAILTLYSGQGINMHNPEPKPRPTLFTFLLGAAGDGKSVTMERARQVLGYTHEHVETSVTVSDRGFVNACRDGLDRKDPPGALRALAFSLDEGISLLNKMAIQGSTLSQMLCEAWRADHFGVRDKNGACDANARTSMLLNLKVSDREEFRERWSGTTQDGLYDRSIYCAGPPEWRYDWTWEPPMRRKKNPDYAWSHQGENEPEYLDEYEPILPILPTERVSMPKERFHQADAWEDAYRNNHDVKVGRLKEIALRIAVISASLNGDTTVSEECMIAALRFSDWQMQVRNVYCGGEGRNPEAVLSSLVLDGFTQATAADKAGEGWTVDGKKVCSNGITNLRLLTRKLRWDRKHSMATIKRIVDALAASGFIEQMTYDDDKGRKQKTVDYMLVVDRPAPVAEFPTEAVEPEAAVA